MQHLHRFFPCQGGDIDVLLCTLAVKKTLPGKSLPAFRPQVPDQKRGLNEHDMVTEVGQTHSAEQRGIENDCLFVLLSRLVDHVLASLNHLGMGDAFQHFEFSWI